MTAAPPPMIRMAGVNKYFGSLQVLKDIDLEVDRGQVVVVLGPSGSGKSTLCRTINRLEPIDEGSIEVDGQPLPVEGRELARLRAALLTFPWVDSMITISFALVLQR